MTNFLIDHFGSREGNYNMIRILAKQYSALNICHINAQSLYRKIDEFRYLFEESDIDAICVSETWFNEAHYDKLVDLHGYHIFRCDRDGNAGGVAIYIKDNISSKIVRTFKAENDVEYIFIELNSNYEKLLIGCVYRPHKNININSLITALEFLSVSYSNIIIAGDFNANLLTHSGSNLCSIMTSFNLFAVNSSRSTHFTTSNTTLLDLFFVDKKCKVMHYEQLAVPVFSKHDLIFMSYNFNVIENNQTYSFRDYNNINMSSLQEDLNNTTWNYIYYIPTVSEQVNFLNNTILHIFNKHVPLKTKKAKRGVRPWFSPEIKLLIERRDNLYNRWKRYRTSALLQDFRLARKTVVAKIRHNKRIYYGNKFNTAIDTRQTWKQIREIGIIGRQFRTNDVDVNALNDKFVNILQPPVQPNFYDQNSFVDPLNSINLFYFQCFSLADIVEGFQAVKSNAVGLDDIHPRFIKLILPWVIRYINHLFNTIVTTSTFPAEWKYAKVIPVPKADKEYRPISILPYLSKVFERLLHKQITGYIYERKLLTDRQSGFRSQHSCTTALTEVVENIRRNLDDSQVTFLVLLDHSKAFDTVEYQTLLLKLRKMFYFSLTALKLMSSYLSNRLQSVVNNGTVSSPLILSRGVPQGSILGPLLYSLYANDLPLQIQHTRIQMYADDVQLYLSCLKTSIRHKVNELNNDLRRIYNWASGNGLRLNPKKSKCLIICKRSVVISDEINIYLGDSKIELVKSVKNLGIIFNSSLTWTDHISQACGRTYGMLRSLWSSHHFTPPKIRMLLAKTYLIPTLLYSSEIFASCNSNDKRKINTTFNNITRYIFSLKRFESVSLYSKRILNISLDDYLKLKNLVFLHKIINTKEPRYLYEKLTFTSSPRNNSIRTYKYRDTASSHQFFIFTIYLWNHLPINLQFTSNAIKFKKLLMEYYQ